jgi:glycosyltransferase involved in cell wall biosynthesis
VDDGSPDKSGAICDAYAEKDERILVIHQENGGLSAARNSGLDYVMANSNSQWLAFVDSDDWLHPDYLKVLYDAAIQNSCTISGCGFFSTTGEPIPEKQDISISVLSADDYYCGSFHGNATHAACNKLYHRALFQSLRFPVGKLHEDEFTTYRALYEAGKIGVVSAKLYAYYQNPDSITHSEWNPRRMDALEAFEEQICFAQNQGNERLLNKTVEQYIYGAYEQLNQAQTGYQRVLKQKLRAALKLGQQCGCFPRTSQRTWAYEAAYPCKVFWWILSKLQK